MNNINDALDSMAREFHQRQKDAERYRWLRCGGWEVLQDPKYWQPELGFDDAVDAAMLDVSLNAAMNGANA